jgi:hypothetical protein
MFLGSRSYNTRSEVKLLSLLSFVIRITVLVISNEHFNFFLLLSIPVPN